MRSRVCTAGLSEGRVWPGKALVPSEDFCEILSCVE